MSYLMGGFGGYVGSVETVQGQNGQIINASVGHDQFSKDPNGNKVKDTLWIRVKITGNRVEGLSQILQKGDHISGYGRLELQVYFSQKANNGEGANIVSATIWANDVDFGAGPNHVRNDNQGQGNGGGQQRQQSNQQGGGQQQGNRQQQGGNRQQGNQGNGQQGGGFQPNNQQQNRQAGGQQGGGFQPNNGGGQQGGNRQQGNGQQRQQGQQGGGGNQNFAGSGGHNQNFGGNGPDAESDLPF